MLNSVILIGRLVDTPILKVYESDFMVTNVVLAVSRPFKNSEGEFDVDFIRCVFWDITAKNACEYCRKGDMIAVRGRIQSKSTDVTFDVNGETLKKKITTLEVVGERVIFLTNNGSKKRVPKEEEIETE